MLKECVITNQLPDSNPKKCFRGVYREIRKAEKPPTVNKEFERGQLNKVGRSGSLVESTVMVRSVVGSTPALAATHGPWASSSLAYSCLWRLGVNLRHSIRAV